MSLSRAIGAGAVVLVLAGLIGGFLTIGSPAKARQEALDAQRVDDLSKIALAIERQTHEGLGATAPAEVPMRSLGLRGDGSSVAVDPVTHIPYEYERLEGGRYRLCATFSFASDQREDANARWRHGAGRSCFTFDLTRSGSDPL